MINSKSKSSLDAGTEKAKAEHPLSYHQERLWFIEEFERGNVYKESPTYHNIPLLIRFEGETDPANLEASVREVIARHEALRTRIKRKGERAAQVVAALPQGKLNIVDIRRSPPLGAGDVMPHILNEVRRPFDLENDQLIRAVLVVGGDAQWLLVVVHHIVADRRSMRIIAEELKEIYRAKVAAEPLELPRVCLQYSDYTRWQRNLPEEALESSFLHWKRQLTRTPAILELPECRRRPAVHTYSAESHRFIIGPELTSAMDALSRGAGIRPFAILLAAFNVLLRRYSGQDEIVVGTSADNRRQAGLDRVVGPIANLLVLRTPWVATESLGTLTARISRILESAEKHQEMPFDLLVQRLDPPKDMSRTALFDVLFQYEDRTTAVPRDGSQSPEVIELNLGYGKYDINVLLQRRADGLSGVTVYNADIYDAWFVEQMARHFIAALRAVVADPERPADSVVLLDAGEEDRQLRTWNATQADYPRDKSVHELFEEQASRYPERAAVAMAGMILSYRELNERANQLARYIEKKGWKGKALMGICLERSPSMIVALLAVLKVGAAYLPLDPSFPKERLQFMTADSEACGVITSSQGRVLVGETGVPLISIDLEEEVISREPVESVGKRSLPSDLAYCIYTSGSTGNPKGALIEHRNLVRLIVNDKSPFDFGKDDIWTLFHSYSFDFSVWEIFGALLHGGKLVIVPEAATRDPGELLRILSREQITVLNQVPTAFYALAREAVAKAPLPLRLRYVIFGGEALDPAQLKEWKQAYPGMRMVNMYGITETTVHSTFKELTDRDIGSSQSNIGTPIPTTTTYVMDEHMRLLPVGARGELCVGGAGVGRGYLKQPRLTEQRFVDNPYNRGERLYRSGDSVKFLPTGEIVYLGRIDGQVKIRGYRIELGEVESALHEHPQVVQAAVVAREDQPGERRLVAYVVCSAGETVEQLDLRAHLSGRLPAYMVPAAFVRLDALPLTQSGKVDKKALPAPKFAPGASRTERTPTENVLTWLFAEVLGVEQVGLDDNFFESGGTSLSAIRLIGRIRSTLGAEISVRSLFEAPSVAQLARTLENGGSEENMFDVVLPLRAQGSRPPLFCVHPVWGMSWAFSRLTQCLSADHPIYGLQARGLAGGGRLPETLKEMAVDYAKEICRIQPSGPYHILGWSMGGTVAFAIAICLQEQGRDVALLALLDSQLVVPSAGYPEEIKASEFADVERVRSHYDGVISGARLENMIKIRLNNSRLERNFTPAPYKGDLVYFSATKSRPAMPESHPGWEQYITGEMKTYEIDCNHVEMLTPQPCAEIARFLAAEFDNIANAAKRRTEAEAVAGI